MTICTAVWDPFSNSSQMAVAVSECIKYKSKMNKYIYICVCVRARVYVYPPLATYAPHHRALLNQHHRVGVAVLVCLKACSLL